MNKTKKIIPSGQVTFLFSDIEESTKLSQEFPETLHARLSPGKHGDSDGGKKNQTDSRS